MSSSVSANQGLWPEGSTSSRTLIDVLRARAERTPHRVAYRFLSAGEEVDRLSYRELWDRAGAVATALGATTSGARCLLLYPQGCELVTALWGVWRAGGIAVPSYPPKLRRVAPRLAAIVRDAQPEVILTTRALLRQRQALEQLYSGLAAASWHAPDQSVGGQEQTLAPATASTALLQFTSGSTGDARGVLVTHAQLMANQAMIRQAFGHDETTIVVGWLPLFHDMGLIGNVLQPIYVGGECVLMSPASFFQHPRRWLEAITRYRATSSGGPNFAYDHCVDRIPAAERQGLDLSSWALAFNGSEAVRPATLDRFAEAFGACGFRRSALYPCYGLAEATLFVAGPDRGPTSTEDLASQLGRSSCGRAWGDCELAVVDPASRREAASGEEGEIWVSGSQVAEGYWCRGELSREPFSVTLDSRPGRLFLRTGDLGRLLAGELFVTGRLKELVILEGRNLHPQDLELAAEEAASETVRRHGSAVFSRSGEASEELILVCETTCAALLELERAALEICRRLREDFSAVPQRIVFVPPAGLPRTSSGKIRRAACGQALFAGELAIRASFDPETLVKASVVAPTPQAPATGHARAWLDLLRGMICSRLGFLPEPEDSPLTLGLDSVASIELQQACALELAVEPPIDRFVDGTSLEELAQELARLPRGSTFQVAKDLAREAAATPAQEALRALCRRPEASRAYHLGLALRLEPEWAAAFEQALVRVLEQHSILRGQLWQQAPRVGRDGSETQGWLAVDSLVVGREELETALVRERDRPFDLDRGPLVRVTRLTTDHEDTVLLVVAHHLACDLWSLSLLWRHLHETKLLKSPLFDRDDGFEAYARWQHGWLASAAAKREEDYWRHHLGRLPATPEVLIDRARPAAPSWRGEAERRVWPESSIAAVERLGAEHGASRYAVLLSLFALLLSRVGGGSRVLVGAAGASRPARWATTVGYLSNLLPLVVGVSPGRTFRHLLAATREVLNGGLAHQLLPFAELSRRLAATGDPLPVFSHLLVEQSAPGPMGVALATAVVGAEHVRLPWRGGSADTLPLPLTTAAFDLTLTVARAEQGLWAELRYSTDLYDRATAQRIAALFALLAAEAVAHPDRPVGRLSLLTATEQRQLLGEQPRYWPSADSPTLPALFAECQELHPERIALAEGDRHFSYRGVLAAARLHSQTWSRQGCFSPEDRVALWARRDSEAVVGLLAILELGAAYVPLRPDDPPDRLEAIVAEAGARALVIPREAATNAAFLAAATLAIDLSALPGALPAPSIPPLPSSSLAYVLFTSGSTGTPKGVAISHQNVLALVAAGAELFSQTTATERGSAETWTLFHSLAFDFSVWELWACWTRGGRVVMVDDETSRDPARLLGLLERERVDVLNQTPSAFRQLIGEAVRSQSCAVSDLKRVILGGEALEPSGFVAWYGQKRGNAPRLFNLYGITETCVHVTCHEVEAGDFASGALGCPVGTPIPFWQLRLLDPRLEPVPEGAVAELCVAGAGLARGYLGRPARTAERFVPDPFSTVPGARLYRSGDLARRRPDGALVVVGRADHQVKIRGFRVELGEIEAALRRHPAIGEAVVVARRDSAGPVAADPWRTAIGDSVRGFLPGEASEPRLVAYLEPPPTQAEARPSVSELRTFLSGWLPSRAMPHTFVWLEALPLTGNGKVDRQALPAPARARPDLASSPRLPETELERLWLDCFESTLELDGVGVEDGFFDLGGDSIRALRLVQEAKARGLTANLEQLYRASTPRALALLTQESGSESLKPVAAFELPEPVDRDRLSSTIEAAYPLARLQAGVIFHSQLEPEEPLYHDVFFYRVELPFDFELLEQVVATLVARHDILRSSFDLDGGAEPVQQVATVARAEMAALDLRGLGSEAQGSAQAAWLRDERNRPFEWARPPLLRVFAHRLDDAVFDLVLSFHDSILDGWSVAQLVTELLGVYSARLSGREFPQTAPPLRFRDFVAAERHALRSAEQRDFWRLRLEGAEPTLLGSAVKPSPAEPVRVVAVPISEQWSEALESVARRRAVPLKSLMLAIHVTVLGFATARNEGVSGLEANGRLEGEGGDRVLGVHLNSLPFCFTLRRESWLDCAARCFASEQELLPFRRFPLSEIQGLVGAPLFDVVFNFTHFHAFRDLATFPGLRVLGARGFGLTHFALRVEVNRDPWTGRLRLDLEGNTRQLSDAVLTRLARFYARAVELAATEPEARNGRERLLPQTMRQELLNRGGVRPDRRAARLPAEDVITAFAAVVNECPDAVALVWNAERWSYGALARQAHHVALRLLARGLPPGALIALPAGRTPSSIAAILGTLAAGFAYLPLDPLLPEARQQLLVHRVGAWAGFNLELEVAPALDPGACPELPTLVPGWRGLAYVLFTSGSTGEPKAVAVGREELAFSTSARWRAYHPAPERFLLVSPLTFDSSIAGLFWTLTTGGTLLLAEDGFERDDRALEGLLLDLRPTDTLCVPSLWAATLDLLEGRMESLSRVILAGEGVPAALVNRHAAVLPATALYNEYGPTEGTVWCSLHRFATSEEAPIPIGVPVPGAVLYVLDRAGELAAPGAVGELALGGPGVAWGYLGRGAASAERFRPDPWSGQAGARMYRTGDLVRWDEQGRLRFLGRQDRQLKVRGHRVEPAEVEAALLEHPELREAVVVADPRGRHQGLLAYLRAVPGSELGGSEILDHCRRRLPAHMVPETLLWVDELPRTRTGKVDLRRLPSPEQAAAARLQQLLDQVEALSPEEVEALRRSHVGA